MIARRLAGVRGARADCRRRSVPHHSPLSAAHDRPRPLRHTCGGGPDARAGASPLQCRGQRRHFVWETTLLNTLALEIESGAWVITLEDTAELHLPHPHVVRLETREATPDGVGEVTLAHLLRAALRLRPDRLVVGEIRGEEAVHLLQALNTGHDGSMATVHANSANDALAAIEFAGTAGSRQLAPGGCATPRRARFDAVVHVARAVDGTRSVSEVTEVLTDLRGDTNVPSIATRQLADATRVIARLERGRR